MANDPLRHDHFLFRVFYEKGYRIWSSLRQQATEDPNIPLDNLQVEHLFSHHPYFPVGIELDNTGLLAATSTWVLGKGSCDLPPFEQPFRILPRVATPTRLLISAKLPLPPSVWFKADDNHLTVLVLAWAQAEWLATRPCDNTEAVVDVGNVSDDAARWWAAVLSPGQGWKASMDERPTSDATNVHCAFKNQANLRIDERTNLWPRYPAPGLIQDLDILTRMFSLRSPHLSFLWLGAIIAGLYRGFLKGPGGLLGLNRIDIHEAAWTGTLISFIQDHVPQQPDNTTSISRWHEGTLAFLTQGIARYRFPPMFPHAPLGSTAVEDLDLDVRLHTACQGGHTLEFSKITWTCAGGKKEVHEAAAMTRVTRPLLKSSQPAATSLVDYRGLDPDRDISEQVTRNIFTWMREMDGFPISERTIYKHDWLDDGDSDDGDRNCAEGDGGSTMGCDLGVTVGGWISGVMTARCNSL
ncbi:hypothetical protein FANTH_713 [Fusarium anthophilum]|uniref:Uncharacterized protein n=1 Tax=Fusarium anthophilum TaxID=48485 RepID=A0A8H4ZXS7_9HYPO|nr:hypothetical protein FANTH_713 [Fusarium anthophilum]